jgi:hypothetical protein
MVKMVLVKLKREKSNEYARKYRKNDGLLPKLDMKGHKFVQIKRKEGSPHKSKISICS